MTGWHIREAVRIIAAGGVIAYPTDTVYGLGCDPLNASAVLYLLELKQRGIAQGIILIASRWQQLHPFLQPLKPATAKRVKHDTGKPVTWLLPARPDVPVWLRGRHDTLAIRVTRHPAVTALCDRWDGPLVSTSANRHGRKPAASPLEVYRAFGNSLDYVLAGPPGTGHPSEIRDGLTGRVLRSG
jgi:L-threonylcarbamoyladenylate synthase